MHKQLCVYERERCQEKNKESPIFKIKNKYVCSKWHRLIPYFSWGTLKKFCPQYLTLLYRFKLYQPLNSHFAEGPAVYHKPPQANHSQNTSWLI